MSKDLAAFAQDVVEVVLSHLATVLRSTFKTTNLCIAGGVGQNCVAAGRLISEGIVDELYVQPAATDNGVSLGAALEVARRAGELRRTPMKSMYWGPQFDEHQIEGVLKRSGIDYDRPDDIAEATGRLLADGLIVGWFQGRMEVGARH